MGRDFDGEIRKLRQYIQDIDNAIAYFERLEAQLAVTEKRPAKAGNPKSARLLEMKQQPKQKTGSERS